MKNAHGRTRAREHVSTSTRSPRPLRVTPSTSADYPISVSVSARSPTRTRRTIQHGSGWFGPGPSQQELDEKVARKAEMLYMEKIASDVAEKIAKMRASGQEKQRARYAKEYKERGERIRKDDRS